MRGYVIKSYLRPDLFDIFRNSHRLQCTHCARCDFQNLLKNIRLYDPKNLRNALLRLSDIILEIFISDVTRLFMVTIVHCPKRHEKVAIGFSP